MDNDFRMLEPARKVAAALKPRFQHLCLDPTLQYGLYLVDITSRKLMGEALFMTSTLPEQYRKGNVTLRLLVYPPDRHFRPCDARDMVNGKWPLSSLNSASMVNIQISSILVKLKHLKSEFDMQGLGINITGFFGRWNGQRISSNKSLAFYNINPNMADLAACNNLILVCPLNNSDMVKPRLTVPMPMSAASILPPPPPAVIPEVQLITVVTDDGEKIEVEMVVERNPKRERDTSKISAQQTAKQPSLVKGKTLSKKQKLKRKKKGSDDDDDDSSDDDLDEILSSGIVAAVDEDQLREINLIESEVQGKATLKAELIEEKTSILEMIYETADPRIKRKVQGMLSTNESAITQAEEDLVVLEAKKSNALQPKPPPPPPQPPRGALKRPLDREWTREEPRGRETYQEDSRDRVSDRWGQDRERYRGGDRDRQWRRREDSVDRDRRR